MLISLNRFSLDLELRVDICMHLIATTSYLPRFLWALYTVEKAPLPIELDMVYPAMALGDAGAKRGRGGEGIL